MTTAIIIDRPDGPRPTSCIGSFSSYVWFAAARSAAFADVEEIFPPCWGIMMKLRTNRKIASATIMAIIFLIVSPDVH